MMGESKFEFAARLDQLPLALAALLTQAQSQGLAAGEAQRLRLVLEELFTNTVVHGHRGDCDATVRVALHADADRIELGFDDQAPPFNFVKQAEAARAALQSLKGGTEERPTGRLGLPLILAMVAHVAYRYEDGWNRLQLIFKRAT